MRVRALVLRIWSGLSSESSLKRYFGPVNIIFDFLKQTINFNVSFTKNLFIRFSSNIQKIHDDGLSQSKKGWITFSVITWPFLKFWGLINFCWLVLLKIFSNYFALILLFITKITYIIIYYKNYIFKDLFSVDLNYIKVMYKLHFHISIVVHLNLIHNFLDFSWTLFLAYL